MFLPVGDTPNPPRFTPWVNWGLIAINILVYIFVSFPLSHTAPDPSDPNLNTYIRLMASRLHPNSLRELLDSISAYDLVVFEHGYKPGRPSISDLFSSLFLHGGLMHLAGNMLFLWIFGDNVEHRLGRARYLLLYLTTGALATLAFAFFAGPSLTPLVGASGAISGVLGLYFVMFPRNRVKVFVALFPFFFDFVLLPVRWVLAFYVIIDNLLPFLTSGGGPVAYGAHLGGFFAGAAIAWIGERSSWRVAPRQERVTTPETDTLLGAIRSGDRGRSLELARTTGTRPLPVREQLELAEWMLDAGYAIAADDILRRMISTSSGLTKPDLAKAHLLIGILRIRQGQHASAYQYLLAVLDLDADPEITRQAKNALLKINVYQRRS